MMRTEAFDVVVLDRKLPDISGIEILESLRNEAHPPILILSAIDQTADRVEGLRAGAEDYLCKPFDFNELLLRLQALVRRSGGGASSELFVLGDLEVNWLEQSVIRAGRPISLTKRELNLLRVLIEQRGKTVTRSMLLEKVWGYDFNPGTNLIDVHMSKLRNKLDKGFGRTLLRTIRNVGYEFG